MILLGARLWLGQPGLGLLRPGRAGPYGQAGPGRAGILEDFVYDNAGPGLLRPSRRRTRVTYLMFMWVNLVYYVFNVHVGKFALYTEPVF